MAIKRQQDEYRDHLALVLDALEINLEAYKNGRVGGWLAISTQLYILLVDPSRGQPLITRLLADFTLHPINKPDISRKPTKYLLHFSREVVFDKTKPKLPLKDWLDQTLDVLHINTSGKSKGVYISIRELIEETRNQAGGGHFDPKIRETIRATTGFKLVEEGKSIPYHIKRLIEISEYIIPEIRSQYQNRYQGDARVESHMMVLRGLSYVKSEFDKKVDINNGIFIHAICYIYKTDIDAPRTFFHIASLDNKFELKVATNEHNKLHAYLVSPTGEVVSTNSFEQKQFEAKLLFLVCALRKNKGKMVLDLCLDDNICEAVDIDNFIAAERSLIFSVGAT